MLHTPPGGSATLAVVPLLPSSLVYIHSRLHLPLIVHGLLCIMPCLCHHLSHVFIRGQTTSMCFWWPCKIHYDGSVQTLHAPRKRMMVEDKWLALVLAARGGIFDHSWRCQGRRQIAGSCAGCQRRNLWPQLGAPSGSRNGALWFRSEFPQFQL